MSQGYQIQKFLKQIDQTFDYYGDIDTNILYDYASSFRNRVADTIRDGLDDYKSYYDEEDKADAEYIIPIATDFIRYLENYSAEDSYSNCSKVLKDIFEYFPDTKNDLKRVNLGQYLSRSLSDDFYWVEEWIEIYLKRIEKISNDLDLAYRFLGCPPIDLDVYYFFDKNTIKKLAKTAEGKKFLDAYFPDDEITQSLVEDFANFVFYYAAFPNQFDAPDDPYEMKDVLNDLFSTDEKQLKLWTKFSKNTKYSKTSKQAKELLKTDKNTLLQLKPKLMEEFNNLIKMEYY